MRSRRLMLVVLIAACGTSASEGARVPEASGAHDSPRQADRCTTEYIADGDTTVFTLNVEEVGVVVGAMPGNGWQVRCTPGEPRVFFAQQQTPARLLAIERHPRTMSVPPIKPHALKLIDTVLRHANAESNSHVTALEPQILDEQTFVASVYGTLHGAAGAQLIVHRMVPSRAGIFSYQLAETNTDLSAIEPHLDVMVDAARGFSIRRSVGSETW